MKKNTLGWISLLLVVVGGLNWGLVGLFKLDLVASIFGAWPMVQNAVYILVGAAAVYELFTALMGSKEAKAEEQP